METLDAIEKRWGCRKYKDDPIENEVLGLILNAGRLSPSAGNLQDRAFIIVKDSGLKTEISRAAGNQTWMQTAPIHIVVISENRKNGKFFGSKGEKVYSIQDTAFATENMLIAATDLGLGCSLVVGFNEEKIKDLLKIEPPAEPYAIITLGKAAETPKPSAKYGLERFVYFDKYGARAVDSELVFGNIMHARQLIAEKMISWGIEQPQKATVGFLNRLKSLFKGKKQEEMHDHFMEAPKKEEMPREIPKK